MRERKEEGKERGIEEGRLSSEGIKEHFGVGKEQVLSSRGNVLESANRMLQLESVRKMSSDRDTLQKEFKEIIRKAGNETESEQSRLDYIILKMDLLRKAIKPESSSPQNTKRESKERNDA